LLLPTLKTKQKLLLIMFATPTITTEWQNGWRKMFYEEFHRSSITDTSRRFNVDDVDAGYKRLLSQGAQMLNEPTTHPWGARSVQFKDPGGNILNFCTMTISDPSGRTETPFLKNTTIFSTNVK